MMQIMTMQEHAQMKTMRTIRKMQEDSEHEYMRAMKTNEEKKKHTGTVDFQCQIKFSTKAV